MEHTPTEEPRRGGAADCVFCARRDQPPPLVETSDLLCMPDRYPLVPGHTLILPKRHLACYAAASATELTQVEQLADQVARFLENVYQAEVFAWENGVAGQSVFHAHLHLCPVPKPGLDVQLGTFRDVVEVSGLNEAVAEFERSGAYRYLELRGHKYVLGAHSPAIGEIVNALIASTSLTQKNGQWVKTTTPDDVSRLNASWVEWKGA